MTKLLGQIDPKTKELVKGKRCTFVKAGAIVMVRLAVAGGSVLVERFSDVPQLGRFTLRDEGKTIAIGKITELPKRKPGDAKGKPKEETA